MRLFIAINLSQKTREELLLHQLELQKQLVKGRLSQPENMHLTLAFLGECDQSGLDAAKAAMDATAFRPLEICIDRLGRFRRSQGEIWWAGLKANAELQSLQRRLSHKLIGAGFQLDEREYRPHITLAREVQANTAPWPIRAIQQEIHHYELMKSERIDGRLVYSALYRVG